MGNRVTINHSWLLIKTKISEYGIYNRRESWTRSKFWPGNALTSCQDPHSYQNKIKIDLKFTLRHTRWFKQEKIEKKNKRKKLGLMNTQTYNLDQW